MWANGRPTARIPLGDIGRRLSPFPFILMLGQDDNERIMGEKLAGFGVEVRLEHRAHRLHAGARIVSRRR